MRRPFRVALSAAVIAAFSVLPAAAVQSGTPTTGYPSVGFAFISFGTTCNPWNTTAGCSAVLISDGSTKPIAAISTADCVLAVQSTVAFFRDFYGSATAWLSFNAEDPYVCDPGDPTAFRNALRIPDSGYVVHPGFTGRGPYEDSGVGKDDVGVLLPESRDGVAPLSVATLPAEGFLGTLAEQAPLTSVGVAPSSAPQFGFAQGRFGLHSFDVFEVKRRLAPAISIATSPSTHVTRIDLAQDDHSCYGAWEDGGGNFASPTQLASLIRGNLTACLPNEIGQRLDTRIILDFLAPYAP